MGELTSTDALEEDDALRVCLALRRVFEENGVSSYDVEELTGIPNASLRRMAQRQEPKPSQLARIERALGVPLGTVLRLAALINVDSMEEMLATDPNLHPVLRRAAVAHYRADVELSLPHSR